MLHLLIDENFNHRILRGLKLRFPHLDHVVVHYVDLKGSDDPPLLAWAAEHNRIWVTHDLKSIPKFAFDRVAAGQMMPGVIAIPKSLPIGLAIEDLMIIIECCEQADLENQVIRLPL